MTLALPPPTTASRLEFTLEPYGLAHEPDCIVIAPCAINYSRNPFVTAIVDLLILIVVRASKDVWIVRIKNASNAVAAGKPVFAGIFHRIL